MIKSYIAQEYPNGYFYHFPSETFVVGTHCTSLNETLAMSNTTNVLVENENYIFQLKKKQHLITRCDLNQTLYGPRRKKTCLWGFANNKGSDQPAHLRRLISVFIIRFLESTISKHD